MMRKLLIFGAAAVALVLVLVAYVTLADRSTPQGQAPLAEVTPRVFDEFRAAFNEARGRVRIIVLLSPT